VPLPGVVPILFVDPPGTEIWHTNSGLRLFPHGYITRDSQPQA
jgi:hypothetical protein